MNRRADRQSDGLGDASLLLRRGLWGSRPAAPRTPTLVPRAVCLTVKPVGEPDAGNPHVRFDERGWETERCRMAQATAPILDSTWAAAPGCPHLLRFWEGNRTTVGHQSSGSEVVTVAAIKPWYRPIQHVGMALLEGHMAIQIRRRE